MTVKKCVLLQGLVLSLVAVIAIQGGLTAPLTYKNQGTVQRLIPVPNQYVAGLTDEETENLKANKAQTLQSISDSVPNAIEAKSLGGGLVRIITSQPLPSPVPTAAKTAGRTGIPVQFIYQVYQSPKSGLQVFPRPEVVVCIKDNADIDSIALLYGLTVIRGLLFTDNQFVLGLDPSLDPFEVSDELWDDQDVIWANPNLARQFEKRFHPNDPMYPQQWHLNNTGQNGATPGADIRAEAAWDLQMPSADTVIAIVDDAIETSHPDLNIYTNEAEANGQAGVDDDNNGLVDDIHGWDFGDNDNDPSPHVEDLAHGTSVAGVAAAIGNNGEGVVGASFGSTILPCRIALGDTETEEADTMFDDRTADALRYAAKYADVINNSWGGAELTDIISSALDFATSDQGKRGDKGVPVLFASGNDATSFMMFESDETFLPGSYTIEFVYEKDGSGSAGEDLVLIDDAGFVNVETEDYMETIMAFEGFIYPGVSFAGDVPFQVVESDLSEFGYAYQSGAIGDNQVSKLVWEVSLSDEAYFGCTFRYSTEKNKDVFRILIDGEPMYGGIVTDYDEEDYPIYDEQPYSGIVPENISPLVGENLHPKVINIGSSTDDDVRAKYSQWGPDIDFLAPSNGGINDIVTTDVSIDGFGYDPISAYALDFGGTSSACPLATGVFALVLTANPDLTVEELIDIFKETSVKIGDLPYDGNGFNEEYGYGRLDMAAAVQKALDLKGTDVSEWALQ